MSAVVVVVVVVVVVDSDGGSVVDGSGKDGESRAVGAMYLPRYVLYACSSGRCGMVRYDVCEWELAPSSESQAIGKDRCCGSKAKRKPDGLRREERREEGRQKGVSLGFATARTGQLPVRAR